MENRTFQEFKVDLKFHRDAIKFTRENANEFTRKKIIPSHQAEIKKIQDEWEFYHPIERKTK